MCSFAVVVNSIIVVVVFVRVVAIVIVAIILNLRFYISIFSF